MPKFEQLPVTQESPDLTQEQAEDALQELLENPDNAFLSEVRSNHEFIESCESSLKALEFAERKIAERLSKSLDFNTVNTLEGIEMRRVDFLALKRNMDSVLRNKFEIGRGGDAYVVIDKDELADGLPAEICYKFALKEATPRGRNSVKGEAEVQGEFYDVAKELENSKIGVPLPYYSLEIGSKKMIAMQKLDALSVDDILRGHGGLPEWFDVEVFCGELEEIIGHFHSKDLYHRDMHFGNVMISQKEELETGEKWGYVIDFGLSGKTADEEHAYHRELAGNTFTYDNDYGIIGQIRTGLLELKKRGV